MTRNQLTREICKREGKKVEIGVAQVREVLKIIESLIAEQSFECCYEIEDTDMMRCIVDGAHEKLVRLENKRK